MSETPNRPHTQIPVGMPLVGGEPPAGAATQSLATVYSSEPYDTIDLLQRQVGDLQLANTALRGQLVTLQEQDLRAREEIVALKQTVIQLREKLEGGRARAGREPDDFASAVSHSLDTLQSRLSGLSNPLTDFAVREFSIDAKVAVNVTQLGTVEYRFIQPGEAVEEAAISNVKMTVVPVPKQTQAGSWSPVDFTPTADVEEIRGIGKRLRQELRDQGIYTVGDLLHAAGRVRGSVELASMLQVERYRVEEWLGHAQLLTVRGIDGRIAGVLWELGVRSLEQLAAQDPAELSAHFNGQVERTGRKRVSPVSGVDVIPWVTAARSFLGRQATQETPTEARVEPVAPTAPMS
jgi:predicted flap endonuclease-1-like 5' DNA nuclease